MLICDETTHSGAKVYSKPMCDYLEHFGTHHDHLATHDPDYVIVSSRAINLDLGDLWGLITEIHAADPDYIVLVGYSELARDILQGLAERGSTGRKRYKFIMTDGAFTDDLQKLQPKPDAEIYFTSPAHPHKQDDCNSSILLKKAKQGAETDDKLDSPKPDGKRNNPPVPETAEAFAFDSVLILARAVENCRGHISRSCVLKFLQRQQILIGRCESYDLHQGERQYANYYVYSESEKERPLQPKWCAQSEDARLKPYPESCREGEQQLVGKH
jgi:ABC-type branched-subunit amino acid transport system substrate-binding protein